MGYHKLLERQVKKYFPQQLLAQEEIKHFLEAVSSSYFSYDQDRELSSHAFELSEVEYRNLNMELSKEVEQKKLTISKLKETLSSLDVSIEENQSAVEDDILTVTEYLTTELKKRKQEEVELLQSAHFITSLIQNLHAGILVENHQREIIVANQQFCDLFDMPFKADNLIGTNCANLAEQAKPFFKDPDGFIGRLDTILAERKVVKDEELLLLNGRILERDFIPISLDGLQQGILWSFRDVTQRKISEEKIRLNEEKYRSIIANMNLGLVEVDMDEKIRYVNQSFCTMSGYAEEELINHKASEVLLSSEKSRDMVQEKVEARTRSISDAYELEVKDKSNAMKWWLISGAPLYNAVNEQIGSIGIHLDITKQKILEQELKIAKENAENSAAAKEQFLTNMSHEIRTPMNAIIGMGKQLQKTSLRHDQQSYLNAINDAANNLLVIINDILDFAKIEAGKVSIEHIGFDLRKLIEQNAQINMYKAEEKGLSLVPLIDSRLEKVHIGDPYRINQVLINLVSNAIKFTEKGKVEISCTVVKDTSAHQHIELAVTDTGIGIEEEFLDQIFDKFTQEDESVTRRYGGTGLGMGICKQLIGLMGGTIEVYSQKHVGTRIIVSLTLPKGKQEDLPVKQHIEQGTNMLQGKKILLVEDNEMNRLVASLILKQYGAVIIEAINGSEAIDYLHTERPDAVLMDMRMPVMDGLEATREIRASICKELPIIALTANALKGEQEKCLAEGMNDYLVKPFEEEDLVNKLTRWINHTGHRRMMSIVREEEAEQALFNLSRLEDICKGNTDFVQQMLKIFITESERAIQEMNTALSTNDIQTIANTAHRIKPSVESLRINALKDIILQLEAMKPGAAIENAISGVTQVETVLRQVMEQLPVEKAAVMA